METIAEQVRRVLADNPNYSKTQLARELGTNARYIYHVIDRDKLKPSPEPDPLPPFEVEAPPPKDIPLETLLAQKVEAIRTYKKYADYAKLIPVKINLDGPIGIAHMGDPHIDSNGCDIETLMKHVDIINKTEGMFGANVGDNNDNWVGRLGHLWGKSDISERNSWRLVEWLIGSVDWLYLISGNHGCWSGDKDPIQWMIGEVGNYGPSSVRLSLNFPNGKEITVNARHDFPGSSIWNNAHGSMAAAQKGFRDHILVNGHKHKSGYGPVKDPSTGRISHCIQVATYKVIDSFADEKGFLDANISPCTATIINPYAETEVGLISVHLDLETAAEYLTYLRKKFKSRAA